MNWMAAVGRDRMRIIGGLEVLGAIGLILPAALHILPWLATLAAACLAVLMGFAAVFTLVGPPRDGTWSSIRSLGPSPY